MKNVLIETLDYALSIKRPAYGKGEENLASWMAEKYGGTFDEAGNVHFDRRVNGERTLFCAHLDTVHRSDGRNTFIKEGRLWQACGDVLGADDGAGVALIAHMLYENVPGYFVLFCSEEVGGVGAKWLANNMPELLSQFDRAVAFDRAGYYDVITHQAGVRCCSDEFAEGLSSQLSDLGLFFAPSDEGVYTDTKEFVHLVSECTNLSVGYFLQHSTSEYQDVGFLSDLAEVLCLVDWESLPVKRNKCKQESLYDLWDGAYASFHEPEEDYKGYPELEGDDLELFIRLSDASYSKTYGPVLRFAESLLSLDYSLNQANLDDDVVESAIDALMSGHSAYYVAQDLQEILTN